MCFSMMKKQNVLSLVLAFCLCFMVAMPAWAAEETEILLNDELELVIPYQTYDEFVAGLTFEEVGSIPDGATYCTSIQEFYEKIYGSDVMTLAADIVANKKLGDLNATFYARIDGSIFVSLDHISSDVSPALLGAEWTQEKYTHSFTDRNHVVTGNIYGRLTNYLLTPVGFIKVGTNSYRVPYELSTAAFN